MPWDTDVAPLLVDLVEHNRQERCLKPGKDYGHSTASTSVRLSELEGTLGSRVRMAMTGNRSCMDALVSRLRRSRASTVCF
jgi:hypothetical protein